MSGTTTIVPNTLPTLYNVTGGGSYCIGGTGVSINLSGSNTGTNYQLYNGTTSVGPVAAGSGLPISFGLQTALGVYTVKATDMIAGCTGNNDRTATVGTYPLPIVYNINWRW